MRLQIYQRRWGRRGKWAKVERMLNRRQPSSLFDYLCALGRGGKARPPHQQCNPGNDDTHTHKLTRRQPTTDFAGLIITAENFHRGAQNRVANEEYREHLTVEFLPAIQPSEAEIQQEIGKGIVKLCEIGRAHV